jgi:hypothetical protein
MVYPQQFDRGGGAHADSAADGGPEVRADTRRHAQELDHGGRLGPQATSTSLRTDAGNAGVMGGVLGIAVAEVILRAQIGPPIRKVIAATVTQHVRPYPAELRLFAGKADDPVVDAALFTVRLLVAFAMTPGSASIITIETIALFTQRKT